MQRRFADCDVLVQATSATLAHDADAAARFVAQLPLTALPAGSAVVDLVYDPLETALLVAAKRSGLHCVDGLGMLLHQGAIAFEGWSNRAGVTDSCAYRRIMATGGALARQAIAKAEAAAGRTVNKQAVAQGYHSHDGGRSWHGKG